MLQIPVKIINSRLSPPNHVLTCSGWRGCSAAKKALVRARIVQWTMSTANNVRWDVVAKSTLSLLFALKKDYAYFRLENFRWTLILVLCSKAEDRKLKNRVFNFHKFQSLSIRYKWGQNDFYAAGIYKIDDRYPLILFLFRPNLIAKWCLPGPFAQAHVWTLRLL